VPAAWLSLACDRVRTAESVGTKEELWDNVEDTTDEPDRSAGIAGVLKASEFLASFFALLKLARFDFFFRPIAAKFRKEKHNQM